MRSRRDEIEYYSDFVALPKVNSEVDRYCSNSARHYLSTDESLSRVVSHQLRPRILGELRCRNAAY